MMVAGLKLGTRVPRAAFWVLPGRVCSRRVLCAFFLAVPPRATSLPRLCAVSAPCHCVHVSLCLSVPNLSPCVPAHTGSVSMSPCVFCVYSPYGHSSTMSVFKCLVSVSLSVLGLCLCAPLCLCPCPCP